MSYELQKLVNQLRADGIRFDHRVSVERLDDATSYIKDAFDFYTSRVSGFETYDGRRFDANESAVLARQLLFVRSKEVNQYFTRTKARLFIPVSNEIPSGAESFSTKVWTQIGQAMLIANYGDDLPASDAYVTEVIGGVRSIGNSYRYSIQDLRRSSMAGGQSLDSRRASAARLVHEKKVESIACLGDTGTSLPGFAKNSNVTILTAGSGGFTGGWASATAAQIWADLKLLEQTVVTQSLDIHHPTTLVLDEVSFSRADSLPANSFTQRSVLREFIDNATYIKEVDQWAGMLNTAGASSNKRALCYERSIENEALEIPQEFEVFAPQQRNLEFVVPCHSRIAGSYVYYPLSMVYGDGL